MRPLLFSPLPFKGGDQGVGQNRWGLDAPGGAVLAPCKNLLGARTRAPTMSRPAMPPAWLQTSGGRLHLLIPSLEREGL
jgi:hypothetical protein